MNTTNHEPDLFDIPSGRTADLIDYVPKLLKAMHGRGWIKRGVLAAELNWPDRILREVKSLSAGQVISLSSKGYCLKSEARADEVAHAVKELRSRAAEMTTYADAIERAA